MDIPVMNIGAEAVNSNGSRKRKRRHIPHRQQPYTKVVQRNERERSRIGLVNDQFDRLRELIPYGSRKKRMSRENIVKYSIIYINELTRLIQDFDSVHGSGKENQFNIQNQNLVDKVSGGKRAMSDLSEILREEFDSVQMSTWQPVWAKSDQTNVSVEMIPVNARVSPSTELHYSSSSESSSPVINYSSCGFKSHSSYNHSLCPSPQYMIGCSFSNSTTMFRDGTENCQPDQIVEAAMPGLNEPQWDMTFDTLNFD